MVSKQDAFDVERNALMSPGMDLVQSIMQSDSGSSSLVDEECKSDAYEERIELLEYLQNATSKRL